MLTGTLHTCPRYRIVIYMSIRLQKLMADAGIDSRRKCEEIMLQGRVTVNGKTVTKLGTTVEPSDKVLVDGKSIKSPKKVYILLNKPAGYVCSHADYGDRPLVYSLLREQGLRLFTVGRLDYDTEGAILITNDGDFSLKVSHPRYEVTKVYDATVTGEIGKEEISRLEKGIVLDGRKVTGTKVLHVTRFEKRALVRLSIHEGRNRQVKRMFEQIARRVVHLRRVQIGFLKIGPLKCGQYRYLTAGEINRFLKAEVKPHRKYQPPSERAAGDDADGD
ncbi:MAG TPA: pseudouridine synthase [bacterium]|nr:pseudouridine synthase [bacterium]